ncbi:MAG: diguanylate cyclase [Mesorhizobium sp.]|nr:MAG: diguanylate cyclase [Mesorhizobium sp.]
MSRHSERHRGVRGIRKSVEAAAIPNPGSGVRRVTLSIGVAMQTGDEAISPEQLQRHADAALYLAKERGRNRIVLRRPDSEKRKPVRWAQ